MLLGVGTAYRLGERFFVAAQFGLPCIELSFALAKLGFQCVVLFPPCGFAPGQFGFPPFELGKLLGALLIEIFPLVAERGLASLDFLLALVEPEMRIRPLGRPASQNALQGRSLPLELDCLGLMLLPKRFQTGEFLVELFRTLVQRGTACAQFGRLLLDPFLRFRLIALPVFPIPLQRFASQFQIGHPLRRIRAILPLSGTGGGLTAQLSDLAPRAPELSRKTMEFVWIGLQGNRLRRLQFSCRSASVDNPGQENALLGGPVVSDGRVAIGVEDLQIDGADAQAIALFEAGIGEWTPIQTGIA